MGNQPSIYGDFIGIILDPMGHDQQKPFSLEAMVHVYILFRLNYQLPFQEPKLEVPTIYKAYIRQNMVLYGKVPPF